MIGHDFKKPFGNSRLESNWPVILRAIRQELNASQYDLSRFTGLSQSKICRLENGRGEISVKELKQIAQALHVPFAELESASISNNPEMQKAFELFGLLPKPDLNQRYILSRTIGPFIDFILHELGTQSVLELISDIGLRENILIFKDSKIEISRFHHLMEQILSNNLINRQALPESIKHIAQMTFSSDILGEKNYHLIESEKKPFDRLQSYLKNQTHLETFSKIIFKRISKTNAIIERNFRASGSNLLLPTKDLGHLWCEHFSTFITTILKTSPEYHFFSFQKLSCQWHGDANCHYELQMDY